MNDIRHIFNLISHINDLFLDEPIGHQYLCLFIIMQLFEVLLVQFEGLQLIQQADVSSADVDDTVAFCFGHGCAFCCCMTNGMAQLLVG